MRIQKYKSLKNQRLTKKNTKKSGLIDRTQKRTSTGQAMHAEDILQ